MLGLIGVPADPQAVFSVGLFQPPLLGLTIRGIVEGDADPQTFIPYLLDLHSQGKFPFDKLITTMPLAQDQRGGGGPAPRRGPQGRADPLIRIRTTFNGE